jgi:hypothetical protein
MPKGMSASNTQLVPMELEDTDTTFNPMVVDR